MTNGRYCEAVLPTSQSTISLAECCGGFSDTFWDDMHILFPNVREISFSFSAYRHVHIDRDSEMKTTEWKEINKDGYDDEFEAGRMDDEFSYPVDIMALQDLARVMEEAEHQCKISLMTSVTWTDNRFHAVYWQHIKFLVAPDNIEGIERKA